MADSHISSTVSGIKTDLKGGRVHTSCVFHLQKLTMCLKKKPIVYVFVVMLPGTFFSDVGICRGLNQCLLI